MKTIIVFLATILFSINLNAQNESRFLSFSDLHFDPFYDSTIVNQLVASEYSEWESIFSNSKLKSPGRYGKDTDYPLMISVLEDMKSRIPNPDFIIITGDFMEHDFNEDFVHYTSIRDEDSLHRFIEKTMRFITFTIVKYFPETLIFPTVGNDDAYCGNYMVDPGGKFLNMLADAWHPLVNKSGINPFFKDDFTKGGYAFLNFPGTDKQKFMILNTVFFSTKYKNYCGDTLLEPGKDELQWLEKTLQACRDSSFKVWMAYHIPTGIDVFGTKNAKGSCEERVVTALKEHYNDEFITLIENYSDVIGSSFAGHFHRDDFRLFFREKIPVSYVLINSSVSPVYFNNPSYKIFVYDKSDFSLLNYETYYLNLSLQENLHWEMLYTFKDSYTESSINENTLARTFENIKSDSTVRSRYIRYYTSNGNSFDKDLLNWYYNWCAMYDLSKASFINCMCADSTK